MIDMPFSTDFASASPALIDFGSVLRPATGAKIQRIDRPGNRFKIAVSMPIKTSDDARPIIADLIAGKTEGIRIYYPLQYETQGYPGNSVIDGAGQTGNAIHLRNMTPNHAVKKGYWLSIVDPTGQHYLHNAHAAVIVGEDGKATLPIRTALRYPFPDGSVVHLARPMVEGLVDGSDLAWSLALGGLIDNISFTIEEVA
jgi:hypothetical protein